MFILSICLPYYLTILVQKCEDGYFTTSWFVYKLLDKWQTAKNRFHWLVLWKWINWYRQNFIYSKTSITQTPMTHIPWLIRTCFWVPRKFFWQLRKKIFRDISGSFPILSENVCCAYLLELLHWGSTNKYNQHTIIFKRLKRHPYTIPICLLNGCYD